MQIRKKQNKKEEKAQEQRRFQRADKNLAIKLEDKDADFVTETKNISCIGAYCSIDSYLPILTKLNITLLLPKSKKLKNARHVACEGTIVRIERSKDPTSPNSYDIAIYFNKISGAEMKLINEYVKNNFTQSA